MDSANNIYKLVCEIANLCLRKHIAFSVENPESSYMWNIPSFVLLRAEENVDFIVFDACMYGGERPKHTGFLCTKDVFSTLAIRCDGSHQHKPWGMHSDGQRLQFDTALEAEYTAHLCDCIAQLVLQHAVAKGYAPMPQSLSDPALSEQQQRLLRRAQVGRLPRGRKIPPLVSEYKTITEMAKPPSASNKQFKLLRRFYRKGEPSASQADQAPQQSLQQDTVHIVGEYRTPLEFMAEAERVKHPMDNTTIPAITIRALFDIVTSGPIQISKKRISTIEKIKKMSEDLELQEHELHRLMDPHVANILKTKRLLLLQKLLDESGYEDKTLSADIARGFDIVGTATKSSELSTQIVPATITERELKDRGVWTIAAMLQECTAEDKLANDIWNHCKEEKEAGWIRGPYNQRQIDEIYPEGWVASRRFGLQQSEKLRIIDDCKVSSINFAFTSVEKLSLHDVDNISSIIKYILSCTTKSGSVEMKLSTGETLRGKRHSDWKDKLNWQGRTLDLKAAYKALALSKGSKWAAVLLAWNVEDNCPAFFISDALLFGCTSAVYAFNRVSRALWHIATTYLSLVATVFYDDFPSFEPRTSASLARSSFEALLALLGWEVSRGPKDLPFAFVFNPLGVQISLENMEDEGVAEVANKPSRVRNQVAEIEGVSKSGRLAPHQAAELHGKLQYSEAQIFGRASAVALRVISNRAHEGCTFTKLDPTTIQALVDLSSNLRLAPPRTISAKDPVNPIIIYTDGAAETNGEFWGIVYHDTQTGQKLVAGGSMPSVLVSHYRNVVGTQIIGQVELYPIVLARYKLAHKIASRKVIWYIDNDAARDGLIAAYSPSMASLALLSAFFAAERHSPSFPWMARVPSYSNPADKPSRQQIDEAAEELGAERIDIGELPNEILRDLIRIRN